MMAKSSKQQFTMRIHNKTIDRFVINDQNITERMEMIQNAFTSGKLLDFDDKSLKKNKQYYMIIQTISFNLIINIKIDGCFPLSVPRILKVEQYKYLSVTNIRNTNFYLKMLWQNQLILKRWMNDKNKWRLVLIKLMNLIKRYKNIIYVMNEYIDLILTLMNTNIYWKEKHFKFLTNHHFAEIFIKFLRNICMNMSKNKRKPPSTLINSFLNTLKLFYMYYKRKKYELSFASWVREIKAEMELCICRDCYDDNPHANHLQKYWNKMIKDLVIDVRNFKRNYNKSNLIIGERITNSQKNKIISKKYRLFSTSKFCANIKCDKEKDDVSKICKKCKMVYYCSKHCQKIDWKNKHKKQCKQLTDKMENYRWELVCPDHFFHKKLRLRRV